MWDADWLVNIPEHCATMDVGCTREFIERTLRTATGRALAIERLLSPQMMAPVISVRSVRSV